MKLYLISNNLLMEHLNYNNVANLEIVRMIRPLSPKGEMVAEKISNLNNLSKVEKIIASFYSSALGGAKYLSKKLEIDIEMNMAFNDCKVGELGSKNMKMVKGLQDHEFSYKLPKGESLIDVGERLNKAIINLKSAKEVAIFSHKRAILGFLLKYAKVGYNLDGNLILEYNSHIIYDDSETEFDLYEITILNNEVTDIIRH